MLACVTVGACVSLPLASKQYQGLLSEQAMMLFFVAVKVRENQQLYLKVRPPSNTLTSTLIQRRSDMRARITTSSVHLAWTLSRDRNDISALNL